jgi:hypothetical protein
VKVHDAVFELGFVGLDDVAMDILGAFSVIDGLGDASIMVGGYCRGSVFIPALVELGLSLCCGIGCGGFGVIFGLDGHSKRLLELLPVLLRVLTSLQS